MIQLDAGFPRTFGPYALLGSYGRGGMGEVFLASRRGKFGDELCVVKTLRSDLCLDRGYVRRFLDEARVVVRLAHRNICAVSDVGQVGTEYFMTMEHVAGVNLRQMLAALFHAERTVPTSIALYVGAEILDALAYAHSLVDEDTKQSLQLVHRDVSPHNAMISFAGDVKLIDFGLASSTLKEEQTESHVVMGKIAYMAPEQARGDAVDARCDQYAAAVVLYEMMTADRYYGDMSTPEVWAVAGMGTHKPRGWSKVPVDVQPVLARALSPNASDRFPSCAAFRDALETVRKRKFPGDARASLKEMVASLFPDKLAREREIAEGFSEATTRLSTSPQPTSMHATRARETEIIARPRPEQLGLKPNAGVRVSPIAIGAALLVVVAVAVTAAFVGAHFVPRRDEIVDAGTTPVVASAHDAGTTIVAPIAIVDAGVVAPIAIVDAGVVAKKHVAHVTTTTTKHEDKPIVDEKPPVVEKPKDEPMKAELTRAQCIAAMKGCKSSCVEKALPAAEAMSDDRFNASVTARTIPTFCAKQCGAH